MADSYFNAPNPDRRILRNNTNVTGLSAINKNSEFKVPRIPSRYATQTLCSNAPPAQNPEPSALQLMKTIGDKLEVIDKLRIIPIDEVKQLSAEYVQKLDSLCMEKIARHLQSNSNPTATIVNDNGSAFHTLLSNAPTFPPSVRSCTCQASTCGSEMGYPSQKESVPKTIPSVLKPIPESNKQVKSLRVIPSEDENESVVSFFKKNQSRSKNTKNSIKKPVTSTTNGASRGRTETSVARQETKKPRATHRRSLSADSHVHEPKNKKSATNKRSKDDSDCTIMAPPRVKKIASAAPQTTKNSRTNYRRSLSAEPQIVEPKVRKPYRRSKENIDVVQSTKKQSLTKENSDASEKPKKRSASKEKADLPVQQKKRKSAKNSSKSDDVNITKDSLRESKGTRRVMNSIAEVKENAPNACGYDQTDREFFGDVSAIVGESFQDSPNNMMKNMTKMSSNRNDLPLHFFSPFANTRSVSGVSAISTPLSKTVLKPNFNNRLKKPDTLAELKGARPRPIAKRIVKNDILSLDASEDTENSDFSDYENSDDES